VIHRDEAALVGTRDRLCESKESLLRPVMPELDSIRGVAILGVIVYHAFYWSVDPNSFPLWQRICLTVTWPGRLGVNLFFVLSGFLITGLLLDSQHRPDYYKRFYIRRALRILPAYLALLAALALLRYSPLFLALSLVYLSNLTPLFGVGIAYPILWSLAVEEHFYFVWPVAARRLSRRNLLWASAGIVVLSPILRYVSFQYSHGFEFNDYTWNSADGLACGAILGILIREWQGSRTHLLRVVWITAISAAMFAPFAVLTRTQPLGAAFQVVPWHLLFVCVLGSSLLIGTTRWKHVVHSPVLRFFGQISYGLYLIHLLIFRGYDSLVSWHGFSGLTIRFLVVGSLATLLAWLSREYFENYFLRMKSTSAQTAPRFQPLDEGLDGRASRSSTKP
jgi:peptidoglycan/LPS O-acetylase OafA/YrhL